MAFVCMLKTPNRTTEEVNITSNNQHCSGLNSHSVIRNSEGEFEWSDTLQANILAGYYYGYLATASLGGLLADKYGGKRVLGGSFLSASILTILQPSLSRTSGYYMLVLRILTGIASGVVPPAIHSSFARWFPPQEISLSIGFTFASQILGTVVGLSTSGYLCVYGFDNGWGSIFYVFGGISLLFSCVWFYVVYDNPDVHPTISEEERASLKRTVIKALKVNSASSGFMSSAPSVGQIISMPLCGKCANILRSKKYLSTRSVRVSFQTFSLVTSACLLIAIGFLRCYQTIQITLLLFLSGITLSFSSGGVLVNNNDIAPSYAGVVFGIANTFAVMSRSFSSLSTKALTLNGTQEEWQFALVSCAGICVFGAILYVILARGEIQE
uniref:Major facilitator superfamily (MFS) profile domain-containing protein n=1 Tax=Octopus bimaculoides TaxID=37653 RepID=A0A0L8FSP1_OCTBM